MTIYHKHHIIPRHMGGNDDPSNIIELTVEEHAEAHKILYEKYGKIQDKLAWQGLLGIVDQEYIVHELSKVAKGSKWYYNPKNPTERKMIKEDQKIPEGWILGRGKNTWAKNRDYKNVSTEQKKKTSESMKKAWERGIERKPATITQAVRDGWEKNRGKKRKKVICPHCKKETAVNTAARWHFDNCKWRKFEAGG